MAKHQQYIKLFLFIVPFLTYTAIGLSSATASEGHDKQHSSSTPKVLPKEFQKELKRWIKLYRKAKLTNPNVFEVKLRDMMLSSPSLQQLLTPSDDSLFSNTFAAKLSFRLFSLILQAEKLKSHQNSDGSFQLQTIAQHLARITLELYLLASTVQPDQHTLVTYGTFMRIWPILLIQLLPNLQINHVHIMNSPLRVSLSSLCILIMLHAIKEKKELFLPGKSLIRTVTKSWEVQKFTAVFWLVTQKNLLTSKEFQTLNPKAHEALSKIFLSDELYLQYNNKCLRWMIDYVASLSDGKNSFMKLLDTIDPSCETWL